MDIMIKLNNQTAGRDRLMRLLQYGCRASSYYAESTLYSKQVEILKSLEFTFSSFRKLLRLGRCLDSLYQASQMTKQSELVVRITLIMAKVSNALYLLADHLIWMGRMGIMNVNLTKWTETANKYWLMNIIMNLLRDTYEIFKIFKQERMYSQMQSRNIVKWHYIPLSLRLHKPVVLDTIKNGCDLFIPLTALGHVKFSSGTVGILGIISSLIGLYTIIDPYSKICPS
ncbi:peroxisomal membrane protein 11A [Harpegnathos saltator]|uniref:Peroxisomal membrane protein 11B n=1 Tax=Harpegnathos saltator TaxID=610380 RepID=E2C9X6_HARSA|nr:peroxisomal membrane protein 11A [Harpegnathos saltator]XP_011153302.1 peroxisomal membrane protein 11A [Harpegnathos saltator]XP_025161443.1 peroxisomal membrane protein 11A [Harpegnathos saltator]XP_025161444.1 peroxisomal membrane protein 11A [Harpegnathos saltator]EFN75274.1 Peroxisomal membrane protein 11B [Harpegnathos saltator]